MSNELTVILAQIEAHDTDYDVRYGLVLDALAAATHAGYKAGIGIDQSGGAEMDGFRVVAFIELPEGQLSWHMPEHPIAWDGHSTAEKYLRIRSFVESSPVVDRG